jgi:hypothetical protein
MQRMAERELSCDRGHAAAREATMTHVRETILRWIEEDRNKLIGFLSQFVQIASPNPPGDTRQAAVFLHDTLKAQGVPVECRSARAEIAQRRWHRCRGAQRTPSRSQRPHRRVPRRSTRDLARSLERRHRRGQGVRPWQRGHEVRHRRIALCLHLSLSSARRALRPADADLRIG